MVGHAPLERRILVRVQAPQLMNKRDAQSVSLLFILKAGYDDENAGAM